MKMQLIFPEWKKLRHQTIFHLPPHAPVVVAAALPEYVDLHFYDENVQTLEYDFSHDIIAISVLLSCQIPRALEIADIYRKEGVPVIFGGIAVMLHSKEVMKHADSVFLGEVEDGRLARVLDDFKKGELKKVYDYMHNHPATTTIHSARRDILDKDRYIYRGIQMVDLVHASRGCRFNCFPCCNNFLGGAQFRPRPIDTVIKEMEGIKNNRLFIVDNSLAQDKKWVMDLFKAMIPLKKKWVSHPILYDDDVLELAAKAGCWYVYQAIVDTSDVIKERIKRLHDHGIGVEGTILLGTDKQDEDYIKRLIDFLMEINLDMAEFTILTPFPESPIRKRFEKQGRILHNDWSKYSCDNVVFQPKLISPERLEAMYDLAWSTFYADGGQQTKMGSLFYKVIQKEIKDGTYRRYNPKTKRSFKRRIKK
ncbi:MAG: radical SAM protein [Desulfobacula sp.]|nr:radical SAM protein [Desulfobacula sp.]